MALACQVEVESRYRKFQLTPQFDAHIRDVAEWLTGNDPTFGLYLCGDRGNGKTTIVRALQNLVQWLRHNEPTRTTGELPNPGFRIVPAKDIVLFAKAYNNPTPNNTSFITNYCTLRDIEVLCIDDLGTEPKTSMSYGEFITSTIDIISYRYDMQFCTIATSNLDCGEIASYYDARFADRFREMMHVVQFGGEKSFR